MRKRTKPDRLISAIEQALDPGGFISYGQLWGFVEGLEDMKHQIDTLVEADEAQRAVGLYELFLSGCYEKADDVDDSGGNLGMFFEDLFVSWIRAREEAGCDVGETVRHIVRWMDNDDYGFCYEIEGQVAKVLDKKGARAFSKHFHNKLEAAFAPFRGQELKPLADYPYEVRGPVAVLKNIHMARKDLQSYLALCEAIVASPKDCENIALLCKTKRRFADALAWVAKGLALQAERRWGNQDSYALTGLRQELLGKLGRRDDALASAWSEFCRHPSVHDYADLMKYVPKHDAGKWHEKALNKAKSNSLSAFIEICVKSKEWDRLAERIASAKHENLEGISHYVTEPASKGLARRHPEAAAKVYRALGLRIVIAGKSKYYELALDHFRAAKKLYEKAGKGRLWSSLVVGVRRDHARKSRFIGGFERVVAGLSPDCPEPFQKCARKRWAKQTAS